MLQIATVAGLPLKWEQPGMKMHYQLVTGENLVATLVFRSGWGTLAFAESGDGRWTFKRIGFFQNRATIREEGADHDLAGFINNTWRQGGTLEFANGKTFKATTNFWMTRMEWQSEDEQTLVGFKIGGFFKHSAEVEISPQAVGLEELPLLVIFGWYLILMLHRDAAAASTAAASS